MNATTEDIELLSQLPLANSLLTAILVVAGLMLIFISVANKFGFIEKRGPVVALNELPSVDATLLKFVEKLLDRAGWMVLVGLILIYLGMRFSNVSLY